MTKKKLLYFNIFLLLGFSLFYVIPLFFNDGIVFFNSQDTIFHLSRVIGLSNVLESPVNFNNFGHHGTMMNIFYPWLTLYPMYFFYSLSGDLTVSFQIYLFLLTLLTMLISYFIMYRIKKQHTKALIFSLIYSFATYRATNIFVRSSVGEILAQVFLPIVFLGCYEIFTRNYKKWYILSIGMTLIVYSHLLSVAILAILILVTLVTSFFFWDFKLKRLLSLFYATILTILLSAFFLLPFLEQSSAQELKVPTGKNINGILPSSLFQEIINNNLLGYSIGLVIFLCAIYGILKSKSLLKTDQYIFYFGIVLLIMSTTLFPWKGLSNTPLTSIQFTWRLHAFSSLFIAYGISALLNIVDAYLKRSYQFILITSAILVILHASSTINLYSSYQDKATLIDRNDVEELAANYNHTDYANKASLDYYEVIQQNQFFLNNKKFNPTYSFNDSEYTIHLNNVTKESVLTIPLYRYKGQKVTINNNTVESNLSKYGTTQIIVPSGSSTIQVSYKYTLISKFSSLLSLISLIFLIFYIYISPTTLIKKFSNKFTGA